MVRKLNVACVKCKSEMSYPYKHCSECGWIPKGKYRDVTVKFAERYRKLNPDLSDHLKIIEEAEEEKMRKTETPSIDPSASTEMIRKDKSTDDRKKAVRYRKTILIITSACLLLITLTFAFSSNSSMIPSLIGAILIITLIVSVFVMLKNRGAFETNLENIRCPKCKEKMSYPFRKCFRCGWKAEGIYRKKADEFAKLYEKKTP